MRSAPVEAAAGSRQCAVPVAAGRTTPKPSTPPHPPGLAEAPKKSGAQRHARLARTTAAATANTTAAPDANASAAPRPPRIPVAETICMEGFGWDSCKSGNWWRLVQSKIPELQAAGITHLWLPPPSQSVAPQGYLPGQLYNLNSAYGSKDELAQLTSSLLQAGIRPVADIVINHRCADHQDENGVWNKYGDDVTHRGKPIDWGQWAITSDDPAFSGAGNKDSGDDYAAAPDLDHHNPELRDSLVDWLNWLHTDLGFEGWRFDFVRGYAAKYVKEYIERSVGGDAFCVGENFVDLRWNGADLDHNQDPARQKLVDYIKGAAHCTLFDFPTKGILQEAVKNVQYDRLRDGAGKAPGLLGWWPDKAVTFVDNHDTGSSQAHWPFPRERVMQGYAYILTHPGIPTLFWEHHFDWGLAEEINKLVAIRKRAGITAASELEILAAEHDMYVARINGNVTVKLGPRYDMGGLVPSGGEGWQLAAAGQDYAVWQRAGSDASS